MCQRVLLVPAGTLCWHATTPDGNANDPETLGPLVTLRGVTGNSCSYGGGTISCVTLFQDSGVEITSIPLRIADIRKDQVLHVHALVSHSPSTVHVSY